jgi:hypothetical protein
VILLFRCGGRPVGRTDRAGIAAGSADGHANDLNQLWVLDIGLPGPAGAAGGKHLLIPPGYDGEIPGGY